MRSSDLPTWLIGSSSHARSSREPASSSSGPLHGQVLGGEHVVGLAVQPWVGVAVGTPGGWPLVTGLLYRLRASFGARCGWCDGRHRRDDPVTTRLVSAPGHLYHHDCAQYVLAHRSCLCSSPLLPGGEHVGRCAVCGLHRLGWSEEYLRAYRLLASRPWGDRNVWIASRFQRALHEREEAEWLRSR